ncbi:MAG: hypothetical protein EXS32_13845 [Opitutus sp.]|nr:hypothetical protein [Opitutus sp.]
MTDLRRRRFRSLALAALVALGVGAGTFVTRRPIPPRANPPKRDAGVASPVRVGAATLSSPVASPAPAPVSAVGPAIAPGVLFTYATPANAAALDAALPAPASQIHYVRVDRALIASKASPFWQKPGAGRVELPLPGGGALTVVIDASEMLGADRFTSTGHLAGRPESRAVFAYNQGFLHATMEDADLGSFALRAATSALAQFYQVDPALVPPCGGDRHPRAMAGLAPARAADPTVDALEAAAFGVTGAQNLQAAEVHVMMVYTQAVLPTLDGAERTAALQSAFDAVIAKVNVDLAASLVTARVKLVKIAETQYNENASSSGSVQNDALTALADPGDRKMDELHALRDAAGADLVCLTLNRADFASSGLAFVIDTPGEITSNGRFGFSVVQYAFVAGTRVVSHELGHNFGCAHDREHAFGGGGAFPYSYGYRFTASNGRQYHDIMSYDPGDGLNFFSNPAIFAPAPAPANSPGGIGPGQAGESATALTIEELAFEVASYRLQTQAAPNPGTLINVATRAAVGTGEQLLIAGFVLTGTAPKKMLLRAAGPALTPLGVAGALAAPVLDLFSGATRLQSNDHWSAQPGAAEVAAAAAAVGAFAFAPGSADAALLVTLAPGAYTAVVRGANGSTGVALVEAYEVDRGVGKIVNLATRGYADNHGKEMYGGFVVAGAPGSTKRILIRVQGPSLEKLGLTGVMYDPCMEVRNAAGDILIKNDDWSTGTVAGTANAVTDFSPLVRFYNEQQIAATGFAPGNRREPGVLVDLPPGSYTVIVKPFEKLDSIPPDPIQLAEPGIGIVEVYEINP